MSKGARIRIRKRTGVCWRQAAARAFRMVSGSPSAKGDFRHPPGTVADTFDAGPDGATVFDMFAVPRTQYRKSDTGYGMRARKLPAASRFDLPEPIW